MILINFNGKGFQKIFFCSLLIVMKSIDSFIDYKKDNSFFFLRNIIIYFIIIIL